MILLFVLIRWAAVILDGEVWSPKKWTALSIAIASIIGVNYQAIP
jgi:hypothetical protein